MVGILHTTAMATLLRLLERKQYTNDLLQDVIASLELLKPDPDRPLPPEVKRQRTGHQLDKKYEFQPARDSIDGTPTCSHCMKILASFFSLRNHIENGCKAFHPDRPPGVHVPFTWQRLRNMSLQHDVDTIVTSLSSKLRCGPAVCCGRQSRKPGGISQHLAQDHAALLHMAKPLEDRYVNAAIASGRACLCGNAYTKRGHRCMVYTQLAILHTALQSQQEPSLALSSEAQEPSIAERAQMFWQPEWSTWLSSHCSVCKIECAPHLMEEHHRTHHDQLIQPALELYDNCVSPTPWCCNHCWLTEGVVETCPLTLNIAVKPACHATARPVSGRPDGADLRHLRGSDRIKTGPTSEKTETRARKGIERFLRPAPKGGSTSDHSGLEARKPTSGPGSAGHVHPVLSTGAASILPQIQQATQQWKQLMEKRETTQSLRLCLVMLIAQTLLDRMLKIAQASTTSEIWQEAVKPLILTEHGGWNFLTWNAKEKRMQPTDRTPISMTSMQSMLEELVELIRDPQAVVRFKCLKASDLDSKLVKVMPWMLQINMRHHGFTNSCRRYRLLRCGTSCWED